MLTALGCCSEETLRQLEDGVLRFRRDYVPPLWRQQALPALVAPNHGPAAGRVEWAWWASDWARPVRLTHQASPGTASPDAAACTERDNAGNFL